MRAEGFHQTPAAAPVVESSRAFYFQNLSKRNRQKFTMKTWQKTTVGRVAIVAALFVGITLTAQTTAVLSKRTPMSVILENPILVENPAAADLASNLLAEPPPVLSVPVVSRGGDAPLGTFWTLKQPVPLPYDVYPNLPVYEIGTNQYLIDDRSVDYAALSVSSFTISRNGLMQAMDDPSPPSPGGGDTNGYSYNGSQVTYTLPPGLKITPPVFTNGNVSVSIYDQDPSVPYDIYYTTNLSPAIQWALISHGVVGQTNYVFANSFGGSPTVFFITASAADTDGDGLSDGYEALVSHTNPFNADTDGDGMPDGWEIAHGLNPLVSDLPYTPPATPVTITKPSNRAIIQ